MDNLEQRLSNLRARVQTAYDGLGHSSGRPYLYYVYPPEAEQRIRRLIDEQFTVLPSFHPLRLDLLTLTIDALRGEEHERQSLLAEAAHNPGSTAPQDVAHIWQRCLRRQIIRDLNEVPPTARPLVLLEGLAALHPLTTPTAVMEKFAEQSLDNPHTTRPVPIVLFVPGFLVPHASRLYHFLTQSTPQLLMYRGEDS